MQHMETAMTSYTRKAAVLSAAAVLLTLTISTRLHSTGGPGDAVYTSLITLWKEAPTRYSGLVAAEEWDRWLKDTKIEDTRIARLDIDFDIPEFERERARIVKLPNDTPDFIVSARKSFTSDASCLAYYNALLEKIPVLLASDNVKISTRDDHVFYKDKQKSFYRKLYVKRYMSDDRGDEPRVVVSVRVNFPEKK